MIRRIPACRPLSLVARSVYPLLLHRGSAVVLLLGTLLFVGCTNTPRTPGSQVASANFTFYVTGLESIDGGPNFYAVAGVVTIDSNGNVLGGEQDYNDAFGFTSPEPAGDRITGGSLTQTAGTQQGILTLVTNNSALGVNGTETFALQVVNDNHGLIIQYDGSATSSGSFDLQTLPASPSGGFAFTLSGVDTNYNSVVAGGVFSISGTNIQAGVVDVNDDGTATLGTSFTGSIAAADSLGRGIINLTPSAQIAIPPSLVYYFVNSKVIRVIDVDVADSAVGSAYSQGAGNFSNSSLAASVFSVNGSSFALNLYSLSGMFAPAIATTSRLPVRRPEGAAGGAFFDGVADYNEHTNIATAVAISGGWQIGSNGLGSFNITSGNLPDVSSFGIYLTDPTLNLNDPNNSSGGGAGLLAELDSALVGTGFVVPQTDTAAASFSGNYAFGSQVFTPGSDFGWEADFLGQTSISSLALANATGFINDPFAAFSSTLKSATTFSGTAVVDGSNPGRYTLERADSLTTTYNAMNLPFTTTLYQASGDFLASINTDTATAFSGSFQKLTVATVDAKPATHLLRIIRP